MQALLSDSLPVMIKHLQYLVYVFVFQEMSELSRKTQITKNKFMINVTSSQFE